MLVKYELMIADKKKVWCSVPRQLHVSTVNVHIQHMFVEQLLSIINPYMLIRQYTIMN